METLSFQENKDLILENTFGVRCIAKFYHEIESSLELKNILQYYFDKKILELGEVVIYYLLQIFTELYKK